MKLAELIPWRKRESHLSQNSPFTSLHSEMNRLFDEFFKGFPGGFFDGSTSELLPVRDFSPRIDVQEDEKSLTITAELPGIDEKDLEVTLSDNALIIRGEKKEESENRSEGLYRAERVYGSFHRAVPLPEGVETDRVEATYRKGVLTVVVPRTEEAKKARRKIAVKSE